MGHQSLSCHVRFPEKLSLVAYATSWTDVLRSTITPKGMSCPTHLIAQEVSCAPRYSGAIPVKWYFLQHALAEGSFYYKYFQALPNRGTHDSTRLWHSRVVSNTNLTIGGSLAGTTPVLPFEVLFICAGSLGARKRPCSLLS